MRLRPAHILFLVIALIGAFIVLAIVRGVPREKVDIVAGALPAEDDDPGAVAVIAVDNPVFSLGTIPNTEPATKPLMVHNRGRALLTVMNVESSCSCTRAELHESPMNIPPGGSGQIDVTVLPNHIPAFFSEKMLSIYSNDPVTPQLKVPARAYIDPEFSITPEKLDFGVLAKGETRTAVLHIAQVWSRPLEIKEVSQRAQSTDKPAAPPVLTFETLPVPQDKWAVPGKAEYDIYVTLAPWAPPSDGFRISLEMIVNIDRIPRFPVFVIAKIQGPYTVKPEYPDELRIFPNLAHSENATSKFTLAGSVPLEIGVLTFDSAAIAAVPRQGGNEAEWFIDVSPADGPAASPGLYVIDAQITAAGTPYAEKMLVRLLAAPASAPVAKEGETTE